MEGTVAMTKWEKPMIRTTDFAAQLSCGCACGMLVGAGSGQAQ